MKPAGRERDIEIAKLKGINTGIGDCKRHKWNRIVPVFCNVCGMNYKDMLSIKRWSTDRNAVWELLDEMHKAPRIKIGTIEIIFNQYWIILKSKWMNWQFNGKIINGNIDNAFAGCVSQAWIIWMGGKK